MAESGIEAASSTIAAGRDPPQPVRMFGLDGSRIHPRRWYHDRLNAFDTEPVLAGLMHESPRQRTKRPRQTFFPAFRSSCPTANGALRRYCPPRQIKILPETILDEILQERVSSSRNRIVPRGVKRKMSNYNLRPRQRLPARHVDFPNHGRVIK